MAKLTIDEILAAEDLKTETVDVPEWGGEVEVRELNAKQKIHLALLVQAGGQAGSSDRHIRELFLLAAAYGLGLDGQDAADTIGRKSFEPVERVANVVLKLSGMEYQAGSVQDQPEKNA